MIKIKGLILWYILRSKLNLRNLWLTIIISKVISRPRAGEFLKQIIIYIELRKNSQYIKSVGP